MPAIWVLKGRNGEWIPISGVVDRAESGRADHRLKISLTRAPLKHPRPWSSEHPLNSTCQRAFLGCHVFKVAVAPAWSQHPAHFCHDLAGIRDGAQNQARNHGIRAYVWKVDPLADDIAYLQLDLPPLGCETERSVHIWVRLDSNDLRSRSHVAEVRSDARPDLHDGVWQVGVNGLLVPSQMPIDVSVH